MTQGAYDYVTKPFSMEELRLLLERVAAHLRLKTENRMLRETIKSRQGFGNIIGRAPDMEKLYRMIAKASQSTHPVLIFGESGTGKELVAKSIHFTGIFRNKPFIPIDCGSRVPTLIESELFGHVRGAFTSATHPKDGLLAIAEGGTVLLDDIGELSINVRILAATNRDLESAVIEGTFRRDLFFRLNVLTLRIPPLRDRRQDIPLLMANFMERIGRDAGMEKKISDESLKALLNYDWPGNVRELENSLERACAISSSDEIQLGDLPTHIHSAPSALIGMTQPTNSVVPMAELKKQSILNAITQVNGNKKMAAQLLGIGKTTLYRKLKEYDSA
jgi:two-component system response regulator HydG